MPPQFKPEPGRGNNEAALPFRRPCRISAGMTRLAARTTILTVTGEDGGSRLDAFVARALSSGLREAKRRVAAGRVAVNGRTRPAHYKLFPGTEVSVLPDEPAASLSGPEQAVRLLAVNEGFAVFYKPPGLHTAAIAARSGPSLERALAMNWAVWRAAWLAGERPVPPEFPPEITRILGGDSGKKNAEPSAPPPTPPLLVNRLDADTSGLAAAAFDAESAARFREYEATGAMSKYYLAVTRTLPPGPLVLRAALDTDSRVKTRVLDRDTADAARYTEVFPLGPATAFLTDVPAGTGLVAVRIKRGARHQIRAHLAWAGYPLHGDALYGDAAEAPFRLHHACLAMPKLDVYCTPPWPMRQPERSSKNNI